jgi:FixJ family two-component response regulator
MSEASSKQCSPVVYLVDDDDLVLQSLTSVLEAEGFEVRPFSSPLRFLSEHDSNIPGCAILDLVLPDSSGLDLQKSIAKAGAGRPVIFISGKSDIATAVAAIRNGAVDFLVKPFSNETLLQAVKDAIRKDQAARKKKEQSRELRRRYLQMSLREREVFRLAISGKPNKQIATELGISIKTVKTHRGQVTRKMGARSVAELVHFGEVLKSAKP